MEDKYKLALVGAESGQDVPYYVEGSDVEYDNRDSGLSSTDVQSAIDELENKLAILQSLVTNSFSESPIGHGAFSAATTAAQAAPDTVFAWILEFTEEVDNEQVLIRKVIWHIPEDNTDGIFVDAYGSIIEETDDE